jgi:uncharacterized membrane protein
MIDTIERVLMNVFNKLSWSECHNCANNLNCVAGGGLDNCSLLSPLLIFLVLIVAILIIALIWGYFKWKKDVRD